MRKLSTKTNSLLSIESKKSSEPLAAFFCLIVSLIIENCVLGIDYFMRGNPPDQRTMSND
jgi:hypothetical protein